MCCQQRISVRCRIVLSAAIEFLLPNCVVGSESVLLPNGVACIKLVFAAEWWCLQGFASEWCCQQQISFRCRMVVSTANKVSLPNGVACNKLVFNVEWWCLERIRFHYRMVLPVANQFSLSDRIACSK